MPERIDGRGLLLAALLMAAAGQAAPPARDPAIAVAEQFQRAEAADGNAGLILFIARYPDDPAADRARALIKARPADTMPGSGPDADIILAFDQARLTPAGRARFRALYPGHPLALEAARPVWDAP